MREGPVIIKQESQYDHLTEKEKGNRREGGGEEEV